MLAIAAAGLAATDAIGEAEDADALARRVLALERAVSSLENEITRLEAELERARRSSPDADAWQRGESWSGLRRGMSRFEVFAVLGEPGRVAQYDGFERWEYPDLLGGRASFDDAGRLIGWRLPPALRAARGAEARDR